MQPTLVTIRASHYCEKARWGLERAGLVYREQCHPPLLHWRAARRAGRQRTVPILVTPEGAIGESTEILRYADGALAPEHRLLGRDADERAAIEALVADFDRRLGPATRRIAYYHFFDQPPALIELCCQGVGAGEARAFRLLRRPIVALMRRGMAIDAAGVARSEARLDAVFEEVNRALVDGRHYLVGDRFTAADLAFAALAAPVLVPAEYGAALPAPDRLPAAMRERVLRLRERPAGTHGLRIYRDHRHERLSPVALG
jgi:glutathione S-transferase